MFNIRICPRLLFAVLLMFCSGSQAASDPITRLQPQFTQQLLDHIDMSATLKKSDSGQPFIIINSEEHKAILYFFDCGEDGCKSVQLISMFSVVQHNHASLNDWNANTMFSRAYLHGQQAVLESDLNIAGGITLDNLAAYLAYYFSAIPDFAEYLQTTSGIEQRDVLPDNKNSSGNQSQKKPTISLYIEQVKESGNGCEVTLGAYNLEKSSLPDLKVVLVSTDVALDRQRLGFNFGRINSDKAASRTQVINQTNCWRVFKMEVKSVSGCGVSRCEGKTMMDLGGPLPISDETGGVHFHGNPSESN